MKPIVRTVLFLLTTLFIIACGGAGGGEDRTTTTIDGAADPFVVTELVPAYDATNVSTSTTISMVFSKTVDPDSLSTFSMTVTTPGGTVAGSIRYGVDTVTFSPNAPLPAGTLVTVSISGTLKDLFGNILTGEDGWSFTTASASTGDTAPPAHLHSTPVIDSTGVSIGTVVSATFTESIDPSTATTSSVTLTASGGGSVTGSVSVSGATVTFTPDASLAYATTYTAAFSTALTDLAGNNLATTISWNFTTESAPAPSDTTPPSVSSTSPANGATDVSLTSNITATFSESVDPASATASTFTLAPSGGGTVVASVSTNGSVLTLNPGFNLDPGTTYTAILTTDITDTSGNTLASTYQWTFTTIDASVPELSGSATSNSISLDWTYDWFFLGSSQDGIELQEAINGGAFTTILSTALTSSGDRTTSYDASKTAGTYTYRVRCYDNLGWSDWSNEITLTVSSEPATLRIINNFSGGGGNRIMQVRITDSDLTRYYDTNELLSPDSYCGSYPGDSIDPGYSMDFDVSVFGGGSYYVFIGTGLWDLDPVSVCTYSKKTWTIDANYNPIWIWTAINISGHSAGRLDLTNYYNASGYAVSSVAGSVINFVATYYDPTR